MFARFAGVTVRGLSVALLAAAAAGWGQAQPVVALEPSGLVRIVAEGTELAKIELNAHGPQWSYAGQTAATARVTTLPDQGGKRFVGNLPIPNADGGALTFTETVTPLAQSLRLEYEVGVTQALKLNGLQVSVLLPAASYGEKEVVITRPEEDDPEVAVLPLEQRAETFHVWGGEGDRIEIAKGTAQALTLELQAPADLVIQDLRRWEQPYFEIRFFAIMEDPPREVAAEDRFHLCLTVTGAAPLRLSGP